MKYKIFLATLLMTLSIQSVGAANFDYSITPPTQDNNCLVTLSGNAGEYDKDTLSVIVYKKAPSDTAWTIDYFTESAVGSDKGFNVTYTLNNPVDGTYYKAIITAGTSRIQKGFIYCTDTYRQQCAVTATAYPDSQESEFKQYVTDNCYVLGLDVDEGSNYYALTSRGKEEVLGGLFEDRETLQSAEAYRTAFESCVAEQKAVDEVNAASDNTGFIADLKQYAAQIGLTEEDIDNNTDMADSMLDTEFNSFAEIKETATNFIILKTVNGIDFTNVVRMVNTLTKYKTELEISDTFFANSTFYAGYMMGITYNTIDDIKAKIVYALQQQPQPTQTPRPQRPSYSSGSSSGSVVLPPPSKVEVTPIPEEKEPVFADLEEAEWAKDAIEYLYDKKVVSGKDEYNYCPLDNVTRAEFTKIVVSAFGYEDKDAYTDKFNDLSSDSWAMPYIAAAYKNGLIYGISENIFGVNNNITREDMCVLLYRIIAKKNITLSETEPDAIIDEAEISDYAKEAVTALRKWGIFTSMGDGRFAPKAEANRAMAAQVVYSLMTLMEEV